MATNAEQILIVDSDPDVTDFIARQTLAPLGYHVTVVPDAAAAIQHTLQSVPDLILANLNLQGLSGKDLLVALNSHAISAPLIVIAATGQEVDAIQAFRLGASDVLFWPAREAQVLAAVERSLRQTQDLRARQKLDRELKLTNDELQRKLRDLTSILTTGKAVVSLTDQRQLFWRILDGALQVSEADMAWLLLRQEPGNQFLLRAHRNLPEPWAKKLNQALDDGMSSLVAKSGESLTMHGAALQRFKISGLGKSAGVIPIKVYAEVIGILVVVREADKAFAQDAQTLLEAMADFASISLVNARLFYAIDKSSLMRQSEDGVSLANMEAIRESVRAELKAAGDPLGVLLTEKAGPLNAEQRRAIEAVQAALIRLRGAAEKAEPAKVEARAVTAKAPDAKG